MKLNLGCGPTIVDSWLNVDYYLGARMVKMPFFRSINRRTQFFNTDWDDRVVIHDLRKRFPWSDASADIIYTSHFLEHLTRCDGRNSLKECFRVLKPGGIIRVVVPDLAAIVSAYVAGAFGADEFVEKLRVLYEVYTNPIKERLAPFLHAPHKCMYDVKTLTGLMSDIGFIPEARCPFDSKIADINAVELPHRTREAVIVEATKPPV
jgi:SAM-dependent methyltransferase